MGEGRVRGGGMTVIMGGEDSHSGKEEKVSRQKRICVGRDEEGR